MLLVGVLLDAHFIRYQADTPIEGYVTSGENADKYVPPKRQKYPKYIPSGVKSIFLAREVMTHGPITICKD